jgi:hypothetical protein
MADITKYKDKINPDKEYEIVGQDILNVINTIDSLKYEVNKIDSSYKAHKCINISDTIYVNKYDTVTSHTTQHDTVYVTQTKEVQVENYSFYIVFGLLMCLAVWLHKFKLMD